MALSEAQEDVLDELATTIPAGTTWCPFGSVDTVLRGLEDDPADIDILTTGAGARQFRDAFAEEFVGARDLGRSRIDEYRVRGEELEVIVTDRDNDVREPIVDLDAVAFETTAKRGMPLLPLETLVETYRRIDKHDSAERLEAAFDSTRN